MASQDFDVDKFQSSRSLRTATRRAIDRLERGTPFQSSRSLRTATSTGRSRHRTSRFQSSRSLRTATVMEVICSAVIVISILAVLADRDLNKIFADMAEKVFQSSRSLRTATLVLGDEFSVQIFQSSRSLRTATPWSWGTSSPSRYFNPRGPCGPRRGDVRSGLPHVYFNPRGPCGPRHAAGDKALKLLGISILAVLADRDVEKRGKIRYIVFQSSRSLRTATSFSPCSR